jgi:hypothetical protein
MVSEVVGEVAKISQMMLLAFEEEEEMFTWRQCTCLWTWIELEGTIICPQCGKADSHLTWFASKDGIRFNAKGAARKAMLPHEFEKVYGGRK